MNIPRSHPRYESLMTRERIVEGMLAGITAKEGLIAHGRGEAFDYLIGERSQDFGRAAEKASVAHLLQARNPIISINGNVAVLCPDELVELAGLVGANVEINIFYRTEERMRNIAEAMTNAGAMLPENAKNSSEIVNTDNAEKHTVELLGLEPDHRIPGLEHERGKCTKQGIGSADAILVPLEDGDRAKALRDMGITVLTVDLNPLSRTSRTAHVTIVDHVNRAAREMIGFARELKDADHAELTKIIEAYDNERIIGDSLRFMAQRLDSLAAEL